MPKAGAAKTNEHNSAAPSDTASAARVVRLIGGRLLAVAARKPRLAVRAVRLLEQVQLGVGVAARLRRDDRIGWMEATTAAAPWRIELPRESEYVLVAVRPVDEIAVVDVH